MQATGTVIGPVSWERLNAGIEKVKARLMRASSTLEEAGIDYAVVGGNALAAWVSCVDDSVVRNTQNVEILVRRSDMPRIVPAMEAAGFIHRAIG